MIKVAACLALCISAAFSDASMPLSPGGPNEKTAIYSLSSADGQVQPASDRPKSKAKKIALKRFPDGPIAFRNYNRPSTRSRATRPSCCPVGRSISTT